MSALAYVEASSPLPGAGFSTDGQLLLQQVAPLHRTTYSSAFNTPVIGSQSDSDASVLQADGVLHLPELLASYNTRNLTTVFASQYPVWTAAASSGSGGEFMLDVRIRVPPHQLLLYR